MGSLQVKSALSQLGRDIQTARKRRRMSVADFCSRIGVSDKTLAKLERGDGGVRLETFAMALLALGMLDRVRRGKGRAGGRPYVGLAAVFSAYWISSARRTSIVVRSPARSSCVCAWSSCRSESA